MRWNVLKIAPSPELRTTAGACANKAYLEEPEPDSPEPPFPLLPPPPLPPPPPPPLGARASRSRATMSPFGRDTAEAVTARSSNDARTFISAAVRVVWS